MKKHKIKSLALALALSASFLGANVETVGATEGVKSVQKEQMQSKNEEYLRLKKELEAEKAKLKKLEDKHVRTKAEIDMFNRDKVKFDKALDENKKEEKRLDQEINKIGRKEGLNKDIEDLDQKLKDANNGKNQVEEAYKKAKESLEENSKRLEELKAKNPGYNQNIKKKLEQKEEEYKALDRIIKEQDAKIEQIKKQIEETSEQIRFVISKENSFASMIQNKTVELDNLRKDFAYYNQQLDMLRESKIEREKNLSDNPDIDAKEREKALKEINDGIFGIETQILKISEKKSVLENEIKDLENEKSREEKNKLLLTEKVTGLEENKREKEAQRKNTLKQASLIQEEIDSITQEKSKQNISPEVMEEIESLEKEVEKNQSQVASGEGLKARQDKTIEDITEKIRVKYNKISKIDKLEEQKTIVRKNMSRNEKDKKDCEEAIKGAQARIKNLESEIAEQKEKIYQTKEKLDKLFKEHKQKEEKAKEKSPEAKDKRPENKKKEGKKQEPGNDSENKNIRVRSRKKDIRKYIKLLEEAVMKNKIAVKSAEFLLENAPKQVAPVKDKLIKQINNAKMIIEKSEKLLEKARKIEGKTRNL